MRKFYTELNKLAFERADSDRDSEADEEECGPGEWKKQNGVRGLLAVI